MVTDAESKLASLVAALQQQQQRVRRCRRLAVAITLSSDIEVFTSVAGGGRGAS